MKFSASLSLLLVVLPLFSQAAPEPFGALRRRENTKRNFGGFKGHGGNQKGGQQSTTASTSTTAVETSSAATTSSTAVASNNANDNNNAGGGGDEQSSLTLDPQVVATGFEQNGLSGNGSEAGEVASLTSSNNFINFCLTVNKPLTNGQQITSGSCNPAPMGVIASSSNMPSAKFTSPANGDTIAANTSFTVTMAINNLATGNFVNADINFFAAPQQVDDSGDILGHSHIVIEQLDSLAQTTPTNPQKFAFFKGLNDAAVGGVLSADVTAGLAPGFYRMASINTAANHQPALVAIAQHGALDDMIYFTVSADGAAAQNGVGDGGAGAVSSTAAAATGAGAASSTAAATVSSSAAGASSTGKAGGNQNQGGKGGFGGFGGKGHDRGRFNRRNVLTYDA